MPIIRLKPVELIYYRDKKPHIFWLNEDVVDSFLDGVEQWIASGMKFHVTETFRSIEVQARLKKRKPRLACRPGWSLHGHGRAVDFSIAAIGDANLKAFYEHMQRFGWYTIFNFPGKPIRAVSREAWHIQHTEPVGIKSVEYLEKWAKANGGEGALMELKYERVKDGARIALAEKDVTVTA